MTASTVITLDDDTRKALVALANIPHPDSPEPLNGIRFAGHHATACDAYTVGTVDLHHLTDLSAGVAAKPLAAALKMGSKEDPARLVFHDRHLTVTVGAPTLPLDDPDADEGLPDVAVDLAYLDDDGWPADAIARMHDADYGKPTTSSHHIFDADRLLKLAKLNGSGRVRIAPPASGVVWRVTTPYSEQLLGFLVVSEVGAARDSALLDDRVDGEVEVGNPLEDALEMAEAADDEEGPADG